MFVRLDPGFAALFLRDEFNFGYKSMIDGGVPQDAARRAIKHGYKYFDSLGAFK